MLASAAAVDALLSRYRPWQIALLAAGATLLLVAAAQTAAAKLERVRRQGVVNWACACIRAAPFIRGMLAKQKAKIAAKIAAGIQRDGLSLAHLPKQGRPAKAVLELLKAKESRNVRVTPGTNSMSGVVYIKDEEHKQLLDNVYCLFSWTNPLHADIFPSVRQMEAEVVAMTAAMLHGGPGSSAPDVCGAMTSGGTESILLAVKAARDGMAASRGITRPELVVGPSAHAAYWKAAEYFNMRLVQAPLAQDLRLHGASVARCITRNTVLVVASAPGFPHGVVDDVAGIAAAAARRGVPCHVDGCLGGFLLPFVEQLGYDVPIFDFRVPGVTSMSVDTHKFGMAHKGTSVVLYRSPELRRHQFTSVTDWSGGLYISPTMAGSRSGAVIATAWASLVHLGQDGLLSAADGIMRAVRDFKRQLSLQLPELRVLGQPHASVVAFAAADPGRLNIYCLNDLLAQKGWHLNALQRPAALHFCFTAQHVHVVPGLIADLSAALAALAANPGGLGSEGSAPLYGLAGVSPDRGLIGEFLVAFQDAMLAP
ncbi:PLP-dependent transferase [Scenedesmus sp. NREL 46B-D3]|nr:PLP-dependent transferase [Scenedesmus sp. NREL 46B-D3]